MYREANRANTGLRVPARPRGPLKGVGDKPGQETPRAFGLFQRQRSKPSRPHRSLHATRSSPAQDYAEQPEFTQTDRCKLRIGSEATPRLAEREPWYIPGRCPMIGTQLPGQHPRRRDQTIDRDCSAFSASRLCRTTREVAAGYYASCSPLTVTSISRSFWSPPSRYRMTIALLSTIRR